MRFPAVIRPPTPRSPERILAGEGAGAPSAGARAARDLALFNAGAAIYAGGGADSLADGVSAAAEAVDTGAATAALARFVEATRR